MDKDLVSIGKITNFHGIKGELKVGYSKGKESQISNLKELYIVSFGKQEKHKINSVRFHKNFAIIKLVKINSIDEAIEYKNALVKAPKEAIAQVLEEDEFFNEDLEGLDVYDTNDKHLGTVKYVANQGAGDLLAIVANNKQQLVPFVKELVPTIDLENKKIIINNIEGLIE